MSGLCKGGVQMQTKGNKTHNLNDDQLNKQKDYLF